MLHGANKISFHNTEKKALQQMSQSTSLVIWGQNLQSHVVTGKFTKQVSGIIKLPPF